MNSKDECDHDLRALFDSEHRQLPATPFVEIVAARVAKALAREKLATLVLQAVALVAAAVASPWLISGSVLLSARLGELFAMSSAWLSTRAGSAAAVICLLAVAVWRRRSLL